MSASLPKMKALYSKLYTKYTKLKKERDTGMENLNREQEEKFVNYVADKELRDEIQRLQQLDQERTCFNASNDKGKSRQIITVGDSLPDALDGSTITNRKRCKQSLFILQDTLAVSPMEELPNRPEQPSTSSYRYNEPACCRRNVDISGDVEAGISPASCIFQDLVQWLVGMKFSTVMENEELCISALHESSGLSFSLALTKSASTEPELVYRVWSLGTFERMAPEWMRDTIMFSPNMCPLFFQRLSRVIKLSY
ncbi:unnamed protein product [Withania somnifera]